MCIHGYVAPTETALLGRVPCRIHAYIICPHISRSDLETRIGVLYELELRIL